MLSLPSLRLTQEENQSCQRRKISLRKSKKSKRHLSQSNKRHSSLLLKIKRSRNNQLKREQEREKRYRGKARVIN